MHVLFYTGCNKFHTDSLQIQNAWLQNAAWLYCRKARSCDRPNTEQSRVLTWLNLSHKPPPMNSSFLKWKSLIFLLLPIVNTIALRGMNRIWKVWTTGEGMEKLPQTTLKNSRSPNRSQFKNPAVVPQLLEPSNHHDWEMCEAALFLHMALSLQ